MRLVICRQNQTHGRHPFRRARPSIRRDSDIGGIVSFGGRRALIAERISKPFIRLPDLPFALLRTGRCFELAIRLEQHSLALGLEMISGTLQSLKAVECGTEFPLELSKTLKREGHGLNGVYELSETPEYHHKS